MGVADLDEQDGWRVEAYAARVHYRGDGDRYSVEYYEPSERVLYWRIEDGGGRAVPVDRERIPGPLRERIRQDLREAGIEPDVERRSV